MKHKREVIDVWYVAGAAVPFDPDDLLSISERARAAAFRHADDRGQYTVGRALLRTILADYLAVEPRAIQLDLSNHGKPFVRSSDVECSVAHGGADLACAVARGRAVGIDVERQVHIHGLDSLLFVCSERECAAIRACAPAWQSRAFLRLWTRKEAVLKAMGTGFRGTDPESIDVLEDVVCIGERRLRVVDIDVPGVLCALACEGPEVPAVRVLTRDQWPSAGEDLDRRGNARPMQHLRRGLLTLALFLSATLAAGAQQTLPAPQNAPTPQSVQPARPPQGTIVPGGVIEPGDQLNVQVYGDQSLSQTVMVGADGTIAYPLVGRVPVGGKTPEDASAIITKKLEQFVKHPMVTVAVAQAGEEGVLVLGNVKTPGKYAIRSGGRLTDAIAAAGGLGPTNGDLPPVRVTNSNGTANEVSLQKLLHDGDSSLNVPLQNNSVVYIVAPNAITVNVVGAVDRPGSVQIDEGDRLSMAISRAGTSPNSYSDLNHVVITRTDSAGKTSKQEINMYNALKGGDKRYDPVLAKGDLVYVPMGNRPGGNAVVNPLSLITRLIGL